jgi:hypothetical protein
MKNGVKICIICVLLSCDSPNPSESETEQHNHPPVIEDIVVFPGTRGILYSFDLICVAEDADGDSLSYFWDSVGGYYVSTDGNMAYWAGDSLGTYSVSCLVSDSKATDELTVTLHVINK